MLDMEFIDNFLTRVEGKRKVHGYIPCHCLTSFGTRNGKSANYDGKGDPALYEAMGASGVTIATGVDLGQTNAKTLEDYRLDPKIIEIFKPYFGQKRSNAINLLHKRPLTITEAQAVLTDCAVHRGYLDRYVRPFYEKASGQRFDELPREAQAVIMSVCYQKGCGGVAKDWPKLWAHLTAMRWDKAAEELVFGFTQYASRRKAEGVMLARIGLNIV